MKDLCTATLMFNGKYYLQMVNSYYYVKLNAAQGSPKRLFTSSCMIKQSLRLCLVIGSCLFNSRL